MPGTELQEIKEILRELSLSQKETDAKFKETETKFKETHKQIKKAFLIPNFTLWNNVFAVGDSV